MLPRRSPGPVRRELLLRTGSSRAPNRAFVGTSPHSTLPAADPTVVGIVSGQPGLLLGAGAAGEESDYGTSASRAAVAFSGIVLAKVDAGYGAIRVGDLLTSSPTPGHAMRADDPLPGTIAAKALEPLDFGTGKIRVLVMLR